MSRKLPTVTVELEDGTVLADLVTDNRDAVRWDVHRANKRWPATGDAPMLWLTFLAWAAANRTGRTLLTFEAWNDQTIAVNVHEDDDQGDVDPTQPAAESEAL